jgi:hypothetical protein
MMLRLAFIYRQPAHRFCVSPGADPRSLLILLSMHSFHELHVGYQADPETCGWRNIGPRSTQRLTYSHTPNQTYAAKHIGSSRYRSIDLGNIQLPGRAW